jgi:hypothetical protein
MGTTATNDEYQSVLDAALIKHVAAACPIDIKGAHGIPHWMRVRANGLSLAEETNANRAIIDWAYGQSMAWVENFRCQ